MYQVKQDHARQAPIVVAVADPLLKPEALHLAAACGRPVVEAADAAQVERLQGRAFAVLADATLAPPSPHPATFVIAGATEDAPDGSFILPVQAAEVLKGLGALAARGVTAGAAGGVVIGVVGAAGGVGASTLAASISKRAAKRGATLIDAHADSGGLDLLLGIEEQPGARWGEIEVGEGAVSRADVRRALPATQEQCAVLTFGRSAVVDPYRVGREEVEAVVAALGAEGVTVVDTPVELLPSRCDLAVIVAPAQLRAAAAAARIGAHCSAVSVPFALVVRDCSWASLSPDELERIVGAPVIARLGNVSRLTSVVERGGLPTALPRTLLRAADAVLAAAAEGVTR